LLGLGVTIHEPEGDESESPELEFSFSWCNRAKSEVFFDRTGKYFLSYPENGPNMNPMDVRQDVHEILAKYEPSTDYYGMGIIEVYSGPNTAGWPHHYRRPSEDDE